MKIAFGTVVYEYAYKYYEEFSNSINNQTSNNFDVLLLNDDLNKEKYNELAKCINNKVINLESKDDSTIPELRIELIKKAKEMSYDLLILGDFDDVFSNDRIEKVKLKYNTEYSFYYNDLYYLNTNNSFFCTLPNFTISVNPILESNFLGLSNTSLNLNNINFDILENLKNRQTLTFDWMIFSLLLLKGHKGEYVKNCRTYYRLHEANTAGDADTSLEMLKKEIDIKLDHYSKLTDKNLVYSELYDFYTKFKKASFERADILSKYASMNNHYWWGRFNKKSILKEKIYED